MKTMICTLSVLIAQHNLEAAKKGDPALSINTLAEKLGVAYTTVQRLSSNSAKRFDKDTICKICDFFSCDISDLFRLEPSEE
jgi:putative transcriptional regulator